MKQRRRVALLMAVIVTFISVLSPLSVGAVTAETRDTTEPRLNNTMMTFENFRVSDGLAYVSAAYTGYEGVTTSAKVTIQIQKKVLLWWSNVDNGLEDDTWTIYLSGWRNATEYSIDVSAKGEYRANIEYTIRGSAGDPDVLPVTLYYEYQ